MEYPSVMNWTSPFPILGLLGDIFHFYLIFKRNFFKQTENRSDATYCGVWSGFALFANVPQKDARLMG